ncbi:MAG: sugar phosphate isomerase/epimerase [Bacillota bacterium]|nr:sugar phosphate isomerase/epimerase [Bacillota bacterium]
MNNILYGMPTLAEFGNLEQDAELCRNLGLNFIELNMNMPEFQIENINLQELSKIQKEYDIFFTFHLPEDLDIASFNTKIKKAYSDITKETIYAAESLGSPVINMHMNPGIHFTMPDSKIYLFEKYSTEYKRSLEEFIELTESSIKGNKLKISIENVGIYNLGYIKDAVSFLLKSNKFSLTYDIGHDYASGNLDRNFIYNNIDKLKHMHIHDAIGKRNHLPLFTGEININEKLNLAEKVESTCVIEVKRSKDLIYSVKELRNDKRSK